MPTPIDTDRIAVIVTCHQPVSSSLSQLRDAGLEVDQTLEAVGIVTGSVARSRYAELSQVPGTTLQLDDEIHIAPPDSPIQ